MTNPLIAFAAAADSLVADTIDTTGMGLHGSTFRREMTEALSGDPLVPFTVADVLAAINNWAAMAAARIDLKGTEMANVTFRAGDMVRLKSVTVDDAVIAQFGTAGVPAGQREYRIDGPLLATVTDDVPAGEFYAHLEWDADADGGPYEDEAETSRLVLVDPLDAHYLRLAAEVDQIVGDSSFQAKLARALWGDVSDLVEDWGYADEADMSADEATSAVREGMIENLLDDMAGDLHRHGRYLDHGEDGLHMVVSAPA